MCLRGRGEKKAGPAAAFGPRRQRLVQNSRWQSELVFVGAASCGGFRVADAKVGIRRPSLPCFRELVLPMRRVDCKSARALLLPKLQRGPHDIRRGHASGANMTFRTRFARITELAARKTLARQAF